MSSLVLRHGPSAGRVSDRRVQRTRQALRDALLALLVERGWDAVDVQSLCEHANIGRSTFYQHYTGKDDLLRASLEDLRDGLLLAGPVVSKPVETTVEPVDPLGAPCDGLDWGFLPGLLDHVQSQRAVFMALTGRRSGMVVQERFRDMLVSLFSHACTPQTLHEQARVQALSGALFQMLLWWLGSAEISPAQEAQWRAAVTRTLQAFRQASTGAGATGL